MPVSSSLHGAVKNLLDQLNQNNVPYCHFKSNEHLTEAVQGSTDLDILFDRTHKDIVYQALASSGFKLFTSQLTTRYPAVEDWIGYDSQNGRLAHLHLHWQLICGEQYLKGYRLPWEKLLLDARIFDNKSNIYISSPEDELILLIARSSLKLRFRHLLLSLCRQKSPNHTSLIKEYKYLRSRVSIEKLADRAKIYFSQSTANMLLKNIETDSYLSIKFISTARQIKRLLLPYKAYSYFSGHSIRLAKETLMFARSKQLKHVNSFVTQRRVPATGGLVVALIGVDGSGKSTLSASLQKWLSWKIDSQRAYLGSGDGPKSFLLSIFTLPINFLRNHREISNKLPNTQAGTTSSGYHRSNCTRHHTKQFLRQIYYYYLAIYAVILAHEKNRLIKSIFRARYHGMVAILDRYPQLSYSGINDGPLIPSILKNVSPSPILNHLSRIENRYLSIFSQLQPDLVFKLCISQTTAKLRKPDTPISSISAKIAIIEDMTFDDSVNVCNVCSEMPVEETLLALKSKIWSSF